MLVQGKCKQTDQFEESVFEFNINAIDDETLHILRREVDKFYLLNKRNKKRMQADKIRRERMYHSKIVQKEVIEIERASYN